MSVSDKTESKREEVPYFAPVAPDRIPMLLREIPSWVCWKYIWDGDRWTKPPLIPATGYNASATDLKHWVTFDEAYSQVASGRMHGVTFILSLNNDIVGVDIDGCITKGKLNPDIRDWVARLNTYTEFSPSLTGVRIFLRLARSKEGLSTGIHINGFKGCKAFELYYHGKALTVTGGHLNFAPSEINVVDEAVFAELLAELEAWRAKQRQDRSLNDDALIDKIGATAKGKRLWAGNTDDYDGDHSSADSAFAWMIARYTKDKAQIRRIMERSGLAIDRDKWNDPRPGGDWLDVEIIEPAIEKVAPTQFNAPDTPQYERKPDGMWENALNRYGDYVPEQLSNFSAQTVGMTYLDAGDGSTQEPRYEIKCCYEGKEFTALLTADDLSSDDWTQRQAHPMAAKMRIFPVHNAARRFKAALLETSPQDGIVVSKCYTRLGWYKEDGRYIYISKSGALSAAGLDATVKTLLPTYCDPFCIPSPPTGEARIAAIRASLSMLDFRDELITFPLLALLYGSVLGFARLMAHLCGESGSGKTEAAILAMQHFGEGYSSNSSMATWNGTANSLEEKLVRCRDTTILIDDLVVAGDSRAAQNKAQLVDVVVRGIGNGHARDRLDRSANPRPPAEIRSAAISTGETLIGIESAIARMVVLPCSRDDLNFERFKAVKASADSGLLASSMSAYLQWLAPQLDTAKASVAHRIGKFEADEGALGGARHARYGRNIGWLTASFELLTRFALEYGAISASQRDTLNDKAGRIIKEVMDRQSREQLAAKPHEMFLEALRTALVSGRAKIEHFDNPGEPPPVMPAALGWNRSEKTGEVIGYSDGKLLYLIPELARAAAVAVAPNAGVGIPDTIALARVLKTQGLLLLPSPDSEPDKLAKKVTIPKRGRPRVWKMALSSLIEPDGSRPEPSPFDLTTELRIRRNS